VLHTKPDSLDKTEGGAFEGRYNARFVKLTAIQINPFIKYKGLELFGIYEIASGNNEVTSPVATKEGSFTQIAAELIYRFGNDEKFYVAARYNTVEGKRVESAKEDLKINRLNIGGGWFLSKNIVTKVEYVNQQYTGDAWTGRFAGAEFNGINVEAAISF
jgi:predicted porin